MSIQEERYYFNSDLAVYRNSNEGKAFSAALNSGDYAEVRKASAAYYAARNGAGVHYDDENERIKAISRDKELARYLHELD